MIELEIGDIILAKGSKLRHKLTRLLSGLKFNHALIYRGNGETQELNSKGVQVKNFEKAYSEKRIIVFRRRNVDSLILIRRYRAFEMAINEMANIKLDILGVAMTILRLPTRNRPRKVDSYLCNEYVEEIYRRALKYGDSSDVQKVPDVDRLMRDKYSETELVTKYHLEKVYDYR